MVSFLSFARVVDVVVVRDVVVEVVVVDVVRFCHVRW